VTTNIAPVAIVAPLLPGPNGMYRVRIDPPLP